MIESTVVWLWIKKAGAGNFECDAVCLACCCAWVLQRSNARFVWGWCEAQAQIHPHVRLGRGWCEAQTQIHPHAKLVLGSCKGYPGASWCRRLRGSDVCNRRAPVSLMLHAWAACRLLPPSKRPLCAPPHHFCCPRVRLLRACRPGVGAFGDALSAVGLHRLTAHGGCSELCMSKAASTFRVFYAQPSRLHPHLPLHPAACMPSAA